MSRQKELSPPLVFVNLSIVSNSLKIFARPDVDNYCSSNDRDELFSSNIPVM